MIWWEAATFVTGVAIPLSIGWSVSALLKHRRPTK